jgi:branched-chain amino acid transport system substrate-binding protein
VFLPTGTPLAFALLERASQDKIPLLTAGYGRADASDGRVFPYVFNPPIDFWSQHTAKLRFIGQRVGGMAQLKGLKIAHVYSDDGYGRETLPILNTQAAQYSFAVQHLAVPPPGLDQKATWLRVKVAQPDWVILRTAGVMTPTALQEAAQIGFPRDKMGGAVVTCAEPELVRAGEAAIGLLCPTWEGTGAGPEEDVGTSRWMVGVLRGLLTAEALRTAMHEFGNQPLTGAQVQWGLEHLSLTATSLKARGAEGLLGPFSLSCRDHEGGGSVQFQQWDGTQWTVLTDWIAPAQALVRPLVEASAARYAQDKGITPRACPEARGS